MIPPYPKVTLPAGWNAFLMQHSIALSHAIDGNICHPIVEPHTAPDGMLFGFAENGTG